MQNIEGLQYLDDTMKVNQNCINIVSKIIEKSSTKLPKIHQIPSKINSKSDKMMRIKCVLFSVWNELSCLYEFSDAKQEILQTETISSPANQLGASTLDIHVFPPCGSSELHPAIQAFLQRSAALTESVIQTCCCLKEKHTIWPCGTQGTF